MNDPTGTVVSGLMVPVACTTAVIEPFLTAAIVYFTSDGRLLT
jgi:hypothetical protein